MKMKTIGAIVFALLVIVGCSAGASGSLKPSDAGFDKVIEYYSLQMRSRITIADLRQRMVNDLLQVSVDLKNEWQSQLDFQYQFRFYDKDGFEVSSEARPWTPIVMGGKDVKTVQATAPNPSAKFFKIVVKD